jgi:hypothetical protein
MLLSVSKSFASSSHAFSSSIRSAFNGLSPLGFEDFLDGQLVGGVVEKIVGGFMVLP